MFQPILESGVRLKVGDKVACAVGESVGRRSGGPIPPLNGAGLSQRDRRQPWVRSSHLQRTGSEKDPAGPTGPTASLRLRMRAR